jgi:DNA-binding protein H-NS
MSYKDLLAQRDELDRKIEAARQTERKEAMVTVQRLVAEFSLSAVECGFPLTKIKSRKILGKPTLPIPAKYVGPLGEQWSGRGRTPRWLVALEEQGHTRGEFAVC